MSGGRDELSAWGRAGQRLVSSWGRNSFLQKLGPTTVISRDKIEEEGRNGFVFEKWRL